VYAGIRFMYQSDDLARAMTFTVLVLSNLGLIHANRSWSRTSWRGPDVANHYFGWISGLTLALLAGVLGIAPIRTLFAFAEPTPILLLAGVGVALLGVLWFESVKWALGRNVKRVECQPLRCG
jgi:Ca2+-transporting ATPase